MADEENKYMLFQILLFLLVFSPQRIASVDSNDFPNVILLVVDNLGFSDLGCFGNTSVKTPNIDRLANEGVRFSRWYSQSSSVSTRASILTGRLPIKTGILKSRYLPYKAMPSLASTGGLQLDEDTLAEVLKRVGYQTAFVGHWGLGVGRRNSFLPIYQGFDYWYGVPTLHNKYCVDRTTNISNETNSTNFLEHQDEELPTVYLVLVVSFTIIIGVLAGLWFFKKIDMMMLVCLAAPEVLLLHLIYFSVHLMDFVQIRNCVLYRGGNIIEQPFSVNNMTLKFTKETIRLLNNFSSKKTPFFIMYSYLKLHKPLYSSNAFSNCSDDLFLCSLLELDWSIGKIINTLDSLDKENTVVILTSSGGPCVDTDGDCNRGYGHFLTKEGKHIPLKGGGNSVWEGDIRVPTIFRWKHQLQPGKMINVTTSCMDIMPTLMDLTYQSSGSSHVKSDGKSLIPLLLNLSDVSQHNVLYHYTDVFKPSGLTYGEYKFVFATQKEDGTSSLHDPPLVFDIEADPGETTPAVQDEIPEILSQVVAKLEEHLANRTDKAASQFDNSLVPWLFPCANMPSCLQVNSEDEDFSELFNKR